MPGATDDGQLTTDSQLHCPNRVEYLPRALAKQVIRHRGSQNFRIGRGTPNLGANQLRSGEICDEPPHAQLAIFHHRMCGDGDLATAAQAA